MKKQILCSFILLFIVNTAKSQQTFSLTTSPYTQDFNGLASSGTNITWSNGGVPPSSPGAGWQSNRSTYAANDGGSNTGSLYSYGSMNSSDRALGSLASGSTNTILFGVCFTNNTGFSIYNLNVNYWGEQWRRTNSTDDRLNFEYQVGVNSIEASGTWTPVNELNFNPPQNGSDTALNGNDPANRINISHTINISIPPNVNFCFRWRDENSPGSDKGMAVDDFQLSFQVTSSSNASIKGRVITVGGRAIRDAVVTIAGGRLPEPITKKVSSFGYYIFEDIPVGETYIISVSSKRYFFSQPSRVINLQEDIVDIDFIADDR